MLQPQPQQQQQQQLAEPFDDEDEGDENEQQQQEDEEKKVDPKLFTSDLFCACKANDTGTLAAPCGIQHHHPARAHADTAHRLLELGVPPTHTEGSWTCVHWCELPCCIEPVTPPLLRAARHGMDAVLLKLLQAQPAATQAKTVGCTPLHWAAFHGHLRAVWLLLEAGYRRDDEDDAGNCALHLAAAAGRASVVKALLSDGADPSKRNVYSNAPVDLAKSAEVRRLFQPKAPPLDSPGSAVANYQRLATELAEAMKHTQDDDDGDVNLVELAQRLSAALSRAKEQAVESELVECGSSTLARLEARIALTEHLALVKRSAPIVTQRAFCELVNKLKRLRREAVELNDSSCAFSSPQRLLDEADAVAARSASEYWVRTYTAHLENVTCADASSRGPMRRLAAAIADADSRRANFELVSIARRLLNRLEAELELQQALGAVPTVRLPIADPGADYWQAEDMGKVDDSTPGFPLPPEDGYKWIPSASLTKLRDAATRIAKALSKSQQADVFPDLVLSAREKSIAISDELRQLERKDLEDRERAVASAEKAAKKLKKRKNAAKKKASS